MVCGETVKVMTHYFRKRSLPCVSSTGTQCYLCSTGIPKRLYGYVPIRGKGGASAAVEMTAGCLQSYESQLLDPLETAIAMLKVFRGSGKSNSPLECSVEYRTISVEEASKWGAKLIDKDVIKRSLCKLWELPDWSRGVNEIDYFEIVSLYIRELVASAKLGYEE